MLSFGVMLVQSQRFVNKFAHRTLTHSMPLSCKSYTISVNPPVCLQDEIVYIKANGLEAGQSVTVSAHLKDEKEFDHFSFAHYRADDAGCINLFEASSLGGMFHGLLPMGLLSSLIPVISEKRHSRFSKKDLSIPNIITFNLTDGHLSEEKVLNSNKDNILASVVHKRSYMAEGTTRISVKTGKIRGALYIPAGEGQFPGVVDMYGSFGGLQEIRAAQLASRGFATFALAYFRYDDLPKIPVQLDMAYFEEAVQYLLQNEKVIKGSVGTIGASKGGDIACAMALHIKEVKAAVSICGYPANTFWPMNLKDNKVIPNLGFELTKATFKDGVIYSYQATHDTEDCPDTVLPLHEADADFLYLVGLDDNDWQLEKEFDRAENRMKAAGKNNIEVLKLEGTGHIIGPPYGPFRDSAYDALFKVPMFFGGNLNQHTEGEAQAWNIMIDFLKRKIVK